MRNTSQCAQRLQQGDAKAVTRGHKRREEDTVHCLERGVGGRDHVAVPCGTMAERKMLKFA